MNPTEIVSRKNRTIIRPFAPDDIGMLYVQYQDGGTDIDEGMDNKQFLRHIQALLVDYDTHWIVEDSGRPIAFICIKSDGWLIEPHVEVFRSAGRMAIYRGYMAFFRDVLMSKSIGSCLIKTLGDTKNVFDRLCIHKMLLFVGEIPQGDPRGTVFLYCKKPRDKE